MEDIRIKFWGFKDRRSVVLFLRTYEQVYITSINIHFSRYFQCGTGFLRDIENVTALTRLILTTANEAHQR